MSISIRLTLVGVIACGGATVLQAAEAPNKTEPAKVALSRTAATAAVPGTATDAGAPVLLVAEAAPTPAAPEAPTAETPAATSEPETPAEVPPEVIVTGSRIARSGYDMPTPVTVIGSADIQSSGQPTWRDLSISCHRWLAALRPRPRTAP